MERWRKNNSERKTRGEEIKDEIREETNTRKEMVKRRIREGYLANKEQYIQEFVNLIDRMFKQCIIMQKDDVGCKGEIKYLYISYMRSSIKDETYEYLVRMYDETYYYDDLEVESRFTLWHRIYLMEEDIEYFSRLIMNRIVRAKSYEVKDFLRDYIEEVYLKPIPEQIEDSIGKIKELESYKNIHKSNNMSVYYGEMMDSYFEKIVLYTEG